MNWIFYLVIVCGMVFQPVCALAATNAPDSIPSKTVPSVVGNIFFEVFGRAINPTESDYWKKRARSDKTTQLSLRGAMYFQKAKGRTLPATTAKNNPVCQRGEPYFLAPELQAGMQVLRSGLLSKEPWKSKIPLSKFQNCLNIKFANKASEYAQVEGAIGVFFPRESSLNDLRIIINPGFANDGHVLLGETVAHEITHAWQYTQTVMAAKKAVGFASYEALDCYDSEAEAFWTEISYINNLAEADENDLRDVLRDAVTFSPNTNQGAWQVLDLISFASTYGPSIKANPIRFLRVNFVMKIPAYVAQCSG